MPIIKWILSRTPNTSKRSWDKPMDGPIMSQSFSMINTIQIGVFRQFPDIIFGGRKSIDKNQAGIILFLRTINTQIKLLTSQMDWEKVQGLMRQKRLLYEIQQRVNRQRIFPNNVMDLRDKKFRLYFQHTMVRFGQQSIRDIQPQTSTPDFRALTINTFSFTSQEASANIFCGSTKNDPILVDQNKLFDDLFNYISGKQQNTQNKLIFFRLSDVVNRASSNMLPSNLMHLLAHAHYESHAHIDQKYWCHQQKCVKSAQIVATDTFRCPGTVVIVSLNADVTVSAMITAFRYLKVAFSAVLYLGVSLFLFNLLYLLQGLLAENNSWITSCDQKIGQQLSKTNQKCCQFCDQALHICEYQINRSEGHSTKTNESGYKAPVYIKIFLQSGPSVIDMLPSCITSIFPHLFRGAKLACLLFGFPIPALCINIFFLSQAYWEIGVYYQSYSAVGQLLFKFLLSIQDGTKRSPSDQKSSKPG